MITQLAPPVWPAIPQSTPLPAGKASARVTPSAVPVPAALLLVTVIVKPIGDPALTDAASATFVIDRFGHKTVSVAFALIGGAFVASAVAVFEYALQLASVVALVTWTLKLAPGAKSIGPHASVSVGGAPLIAHDAPPD